MSRRLPRFWQLRETESAASSSSTRRRTRFQNGSNRLPENFASDCIVFVHILALKETIERNTHKFPFSTCKHTHRHIHVQKRFRLAGRFFLGRKAKSASHLPHSATAVEREWMEANTRNTPDTLFNGINHWSRVLGGGFKKGTKRRNSEANVAKTVE